MLVPHLEFLPEFHVSFVIPFWDGHIVVLTLFLVKQLVPFGDMGEEESQESVLAPPHALQLLYLTL